MKKECKSQVDYKEAPYEATSWEIVGNYHPDRGFIPITLDILDESNLVVDPVFADYGGIPHKGDKRLHLPESEAFDLKKYEDWDKAKLKSNFRLWNFSTVMNEILGAADVVVSRAGATTIAELASLKKAVVLVPFEKLPGGHQVKNAEKLAKDNAAVVIRDDRMMNQPGVLLEAVKHLSRSPRERRELAENLHERVKADAALHLATIILETADGKEVVKDETR